MSKDKDQDHLDMIGGFKSESENARSSYEARWTKNTRLVKGVWDDGESTRSRVRKHRSKIYFRKIWATGQRMVAAFYGAFLREKDNFKIVGRDTIEDPARATVLHKMVEYRRDVLARAHSLFLKFIWAFMDIVNLGWAVGLFTWNYDEEKGIDEPIFTLYPLEQVFPDMSAATKDEMDFITFENYMNMDEMESMGYENLDKVEPESMPASQLRSARHMGAQDPLQNPKSTEYPSPGSVEDNIKDNIRNVYRVWQNFYKKDGVIMFSVTNATKTILQQPEESIYGNRYPVVMGHCLTDAHKMIGEGLPEPLEGPQKSLNTNLNQRKDNISLLLNRETFVSRYGNVDLQSLTNSRPGGITMMDDVNAVKERDMAEVTRSSYLEAQIDEAMMQEMSGITPSKMGMEGNVKATVAQINLAEGNAKIDMYSAIVGETFVKDFYSTLAWLIQRFETDEKVFRIANDHLRSQDPNARDIYNLDFDADCEIEVGLGNVGREIEIQQTMLAIDRANMSNQANLQLLQIGAAPPEGVQMINTAQFFADLLPKLGKKDLKKYFYQLPPPQQAPYPGREGGAAGQGLRGKNQPQPGPMGLNNGAQEGALAV